MTKISIDSAIKQIKQPWQPIEMARVNDQVVRLALMKGEYHWHKHENADELFLCLKGILIIQLKDQPDIILKQGELAVVPKGVEHCPKSEEETYVLMFEPSNLESKGD